MRHLRLGSFVLAAAAGLPGVLTAQGPTWATYYDSGSSAHPDEMPAQRGIEVLSNGRVVVCGYRSNAAVTPPSSGEGFVACFDPTQTGSAQLVWTRVIGTSGFTEVTGLCALSNGDVVISGITNCPTLPATSSCMQPAIGGGFDAFVARLSGTSGAILSCTYLGGAGGERAIDVAVQSTGDLVVAGFGDGPVPFGSPTCPSYQPAPSPSPAPNFDCFLVVYDQWLTTIRAATWFGLGGDDFASCLTLDGDRPVLGGTTATGIPTTACAYRPSALGAGDGFLARFDACLSTLEYATHLGGAGIDFLNAVAVASAGEYAVGGWTQLFLGAGGPIPSNGPFDAFAITLDTTLCGNAQETWLSVFGTAGSDGIWDLAVDDAGMVTAVGTADASGLPVTVGCHQPGFVGANDGFVARLDPQRRTAAAGAGERIYLTCFGGTGNDNPLGVALDAQGDPVLVGHTSGGMNSKMSGGCYQPGFVGPIWDLFIADLPLLSVPPFAVTRISGAPSCPETVIAGVNSAPYTGNPAFTLLATNAPPGAVGAVVLGLQAARPYTPLPPFGVCPLVDLGNVMGTHVTTADAQGFASFALRIPVSPAPPYGIAAQWAFVGAALPALEASPALRF